MQRTSRAKDKLINEIEDFCARHKIKLTTFGKRAINDPRFVFDLKKGRSPSLWLTERVRDYMADKDKSAA